MHNIYERGSLQFVYSNLIWLGTVGLHLSTKVTMCAYMQKGWKILYGLHWFFITHLITFKLALLTFKAVPFAIFINVQEICEDSVIESRMPYLLIMELFPCFRMLKIKKVMVIIMILILKVKSSGFYIAPLADETA
jgi:hypothetical protein